MWFWLFLTTKTKALFFFFFLGSCSRALQHVFGVPVWTLTWPLLLLFPSTTNQSLSLFFFFWCGHVCFPAHCGVAGGRPRTDTNLIPDQLFETALLLLLLLSTNICGSSLHSLTGNAGLGLPHAPLFSLIPAFSLMFVFVSGPSALDDFWNTEFNTQEQAEVKRQQISADSHSGASCSSLSQFILNKTHSREFTLVLCVRCDLLDAILHLNMSSTLRVWPFDPFDLVTADMQVLSHTPVKSTVGKGRNTQEVNLLKCSVIFW